MADPESYDEKYKEWKIEHLPMLPEKFELVVIKQTGKQYQVVKNQIHRKDISDIIIATDAGREGSWLPDGYLTRQITKNRLKDYGYPLLPIKQLEKRFNRLKDGKEYENLYKAAVARAESDWIVGMNATRALTCKYNASLSCGRVQTPTLAMIAKREEEIKSFIPKPYYGLMGKTKEMTVTWRDKTTKEKSVFDKSRIEEIYRKVNGKRV